jgi:NADH:ubiquinone oxidoreductase subunit 4 (subunit M)
VPAVAGTFLTAVYVLRVTKQIFWGPPSPYLHHLEDARGTEWVAVVILVAVLILFGVAPGIALGPIGTATVPLLSRILAP